jgi:hypothetical protein
MKSAELELWNSQSRTSLPQSPKWHKALLKP